MLHCSTVQVVVCRRSHEPVTLEKAGLTWAAKCSKPHKDGFKDEFGWSLNHVTELLELYSIMNKSFQSPSHDRHCPCYARTVTANRGQRVTAFANSDTARPAGRSIGVKRSWSKTTRWPQCWHVWDDPNVHDRNGHLKIFDVLVNSGHSMSFSWLGMFHFMLFSRTVRGAFGTPSAISIGGRSSAWGCHWETNGRSVLMELEICRFCSEWWGNILGCVLRGMCTDLQRCCYVRT